MNCKTRRMQENCRRDTCGRWERCLKVWLRPAQVRIFGTRCRSEWRTLVASFVGLSCLCLRVMWIVDIWEWLDSSPVWSRINRRLGLVKWFGRSAPSPPDAPAAWTPARWVASCVFTPFLRQCPKGVCEVFSPLNAVIQLRRSLIE